MEEGQGEEGKVVVAEGRWSVFTAQTGEGCARAGSREADGQAWLPGPEACNKSTIRWGWMGKEHEEAGR